MSNSFNTFVVWPDEISASSASFNNTYQTIGSALTFNPNVMIIDNQSTVDARISFNGTSIWKTFTAGEALVLDLRANHGQEHTYTPIKGTQIYVNGAVAGTGSVRISFLA